MEGIVIVMAYCDFAFFYDDLIADVDYRKSAHYYQALFERHGLTPQIILDLACGTGSLAIELSKMGYDLIGCDASDSMLSAAYQKKHDEQVDVLFLRQASHEIDLYGTVQAVICNLDSINHIQPEFLKQTFQKVSLFLEAGGLFIFDVNSEYKFQTILADHTFIYDIPSVYCVWRNEYKNDVLHIHLDLFGREDNHYVRYTDAFNEYYYSENRLLSIFQDTNFFLVQRYSDFTFMPVNEKSQRIHYVIKKQG